MANLLNIQPPFPPLGGVCGRNFSPPPTPQLIAVGKSLPSNIGGEKEKLPAAQTYFL